MNNGYLYPQPRLNLSTPTQAPAASLHTGSFSSTLLPSALPPSGSAPTQQLPLPTMYVTNMRTKYNLSKGFEPEDDMEYCPNSNYEFVRTSPKVSPSTAEAKPVGKSPLSPTPRVKKVLEIINPATGLRVGSPRQ